MAINKGDFGRLDKNEKPKKLRKHSFIGRDKDPDKHHYITTGLPKNPQQFIAGLFGLPVERYQRKISHPFVIFSTIGLLIVIHLISISQGINSTATAWGFIPNESSSTNFVTLITCFFLHGSWAHLIGNAYYFYIFGDDVEDDLGFLPFLTLLLGGHIAGILLQAHLGTDPTVPILGASAGISALQGYYMVIFPKRHITYMVFFFFVWIHVPAFFSFAWKFSWEFLLAATTESSSGIAFWAHIGGVIFGVGFGLLFARKENY